MDRKEKTPAIYAKLREIRRSRGFTVNKLAEKMGENYQKVGRIERGKSNLTLDYLVKISKALDTPIDSIVHNEAEKSSSKENPSLLSEIVLLVEQHFATLSPEGNRELKAKFISAIYSQALRFLPEQQKLFVTSLFESLLLLQP